MKKVKTFKYLGYIIINKNSIREEIKCRLKAGNYSVQTLLFSLLISKNLKITIYETIIFPVVLYGREDKSVWTE